MCSVLGTHAILALLRACPTLEHVCVRPSSVWYRSTGRSLTGPTAPPPLVDSLRLHTIEFAGYMGANAPEIDDALWMLASHRVCVHMLRLHECLIRYYACWPVDYVSTIQHVRVTDCTLSVREFGALFPTLVSLQIEKMRDTEGVVDLALAASATLRHLECSLTHSPWAETPDKATYDQVARLLLDETFSNLTSLKIVAPTLNRQQRADLHQRARCLHNPPPVTFSD